MDEENMYAFGGEVKKHILKELLENLELENQLSEIVIN